MQVKQKEQMKTKKEQLNIQIIRKQDNVLKKILQKLVRKKISIQEPKTLTIITAQMETIKMLRYVFKNQDNMKTVIIYK